MLQKIIGRKEEQKTLQDCYESNKPEFVAVYGRRRIGKTFLVKQFFKEKCRKGQHLHLGKGRYNAA